jgi:hypothetical protein
MRPGREEVAERAICHAGVYEVANMSNHLFALVFVGRRTVVSRSLFVCEQGGVMSHNHPGWLGDTHLLIQRENHVAGSDPSLWGPDDRLGTRTAWAPRKCHVVGAFAGDQVYSMALPRERKWGGSHCELAKRQGQVGGSSRPFGRIPVHSEDNSRLFPWEHILCHIRMPHDVFLVFVAFPQEHSAVQFLLVSQHIGKLSSGASCSPGAAI